MKKNSIPAFLRRNGMALLCTAGLAVLFYQIVFTFRMSPPDHLSDYTAHMLWAVGQTKEQIIASFFNGSNRLWHFFVYLVFNYWIPNSWKAAAIVTAAADAAAYFLVFKLWDRAVPEKFPRWLLALMAGSTFIVEALMLPGGIFYIRGDKLVHALNTWHNPTNIMVRPFAVAVFYMTVDIYDRYRYGQSGILPPAGQADAPFVFEGGFFRQFRRPVYTWPELILYPVCMVLSLLAKPSFLQFFAPAIFLFLLIDVFRTRGMLLPFCLKLAAPFLLGGCLLLMQFARAFDSGIISSGQLVEAVKSSILGGDHGVQVYFVQGGFAGVGEFLSYVAGCVSPLVLFCALPLFLLAAAPKKGMGDTCCRLALLCALAGRLEAVLFHETGPRATHGNFMWGFSLAAWLLWTAAIGRWTELLRDGKSASGKLVRYGGSALLLWHLAAGVAYIVIILRTANYQF